MLNDINGNGPGTEDGKFGVGNPEKVVTVLTVIAG
jgi:hypothetical protein